LLCWSGHEGEEQNQKQVPPLRDGKNRRPSGRNDNSIFLGDGEGMKAIQVLAPGLLTTVQDLGREGFGPMGVSASGAADAVSLRLGNRLVRNAEGAAGLEMTLLGGTFLFPEGAVVALTGSDFGATLDDVPIELWSSFEARAGQTLRIGPTRAGARCYLCVQGGIVAKDFLGSASTHLLSGLGGHEGRALRKGDVLRMGAADPPFRRRKTAKRAMEKLAPRKILRVTAGPQSDWFPKAAQKSFYGSTYRVAEESNRMGVRLEGAAIPVPFGGEMISEGVALGAVQITAGGLPIVLFVEQQTTGGYPKIANVISADLHSVGQLRPRDEIRFERVKMEAARALLMEQEKLLASEGLIQNG
jgi:antagonist of KipI